MNWETSLRNEKEGRGKNKRWEGCLDEEGQRDGGRKGVREGEEGKVNK